MLSKKEAIAHINQLGAQQTPFSFYCDFLGERWHISASDSNDAPFSLTINDKELASSIVHPEKDIHLGKSEPNPRFAKHPIDYATFNNLFNQVICQIKMGNSFLTNLTFETPIETGLTLQELFQQSHAKYKLFVPDQFVVFSPETFVKVYDNHIYSYPMKGTIDATIADASTKILADKKEKAEHITIVDLIRNDLSQVAKQVEVTQFRYVEELHTYEKELLQVSSEIRGALDGDWQCHLGSILSKLLPAGSISGAPKPQTVKIIQETETYDRGYYTGICGHFDGHTLDTGVMIRFIKQENNQLTFCSGGGITSFSTAEKEYQEMIDKVYLTF